MGASDWAGFIVLVMLIGAAIGGILMFWDATDRFNPGFAFILVLAHVFSFFFLLVPIVVVLYGIFWIWIQYHENRKLKEDDRFKRIPVIIITGISDDFRTFISPRRQVPPPEGYLSKPVDHAQFLDMVRSLLG